MPRLSRRSFLAASAALAARPAFGPAWPRRRRRARLDVVIIGAGAAGIAAARKVAAAGRRYVVIEATDHIGGRCVTDTKSFGVPYDRGAHWIYLPDLNPVTKLAPRRGIDVYPAPQSQKVRIGRRFAREGELEDLLTAQVRATRAIDDVARKADIPERTGGAERSRRLARRRSNSCSARMAAPRIWRRCRRSISRMPPSATRRRSANRASARCLPALGQGLAVQLSTPAKTIDNRGGIAVETAKGTITARAAIVTVPTNVVASGGLRVQSRTRPSRRSTRSGACRSAATITSRSSSSAIPWASKATIWCSKNLPTRHTAALLANVSGTPLCMIDVAGAFGRDLSAQGEAAMFDFAAEWLAGLYGAEVKKAIGRKHATRWNAEPYALGAWSAAVPGSQFARRQLLEPIADDVWYAGEAAHETLWGTVGGAWESGERAADAVLRRLGPPKHRRPRRRKPSRSASTKQRAGAGRYEADAPRYYGTPSIMREPLR